jgi:two-component system LytT family response regulator
VNIRVVIADDERLARSRIRALLTGRPGYEIVCETNSGSTTFEALTSLKPDLLFLDVQMPGGTGLDVLGQLEAHERPLTVFTTAFDKYALAAFEHHALDYLLKPFEDERFADALTRAELVLEGRQMKEWRVRLNQLLQESRESAPVRRDEPLQRFAVRTGDRIVMIPINDVSRIESAGDYVRIVVAGTAHLVRITMQEVERRLDGERFLRIHRSTIVQVAHVKELQTSEERTTVVMRDGTRLSVGRSYRPRLERLR